jgi:hypothetical protein
MRTRGKDRRDDLIPVVATALVAVISTAAILFGDFAQGNASLGSGSAITAEVVSRAGAVLTPSACGPNLTTQCLRSPAG